MKNDDWNLWHWLGYQKPEDSSKLKSAGPAIGVVLICLTFVLASGLIAQLFRASFTSEVPNIRDIALTLGAVLGFPLIIWRTSVADKQAKAAEQQARLSQDVLFNERVNAATTSLYARHQESVDDKDVWRDDIIQRIAAIDQLLALAVERPSEAIRITQLLCTYVREMSRKTRPVEAPELNNPTWWPSSSMRSDVDAALQSIGKMRAATGIPAHQLRMDLRFANLQACKLVDLDFSFADFTGAQFDACYIQQSTFLNCNFVGISWANSNVFESDFTNCKFSLTKAFSGYHYRSILANVKNCPLLTDEGQDGSVFKAPALRNISLKSLPDSKFFSFGDASVELPPDAERPIWWSKTVLSDEEYKTELEKFYRDPPQYIIELSAQD